MLRPKATNLQTYTDGWGTSWEVSDRRLKQERQKIIHYANYTVGMYRYWEAMIAGTQIKRAILVPEQTKITEGDIFVDSDGTQFEVKQVDRKDTRPVSLLVSMASAQVAYKRHSDG
jgi:hypothetical protein